MQAQVFKYTIPPYDCAAGEREKGYKDQQPLPGDTIKDRFVFIFGL